MKASRTITTGFIGLLALAAGTPATAQSAPTDTAPPGYHIVDRIPLSDGWWDYATVDPDKRRLFVTRGNGLFKMDLDSGLMDYRFLPGSEGRDVDVLPGSETVMTTMAGYSAAIQFSGVDGKVDKIYSLKQASDSMIWEPVGKRFWVMGGSGEAAALDPVTKEQTAALDLGDELEFSQTDGKGRIFVNGTETASVIAFDAPSKKIVGKWKMKDCEDPSGMAYVDHIDVVMSVCFNNMVKVLDGRDGKEIATIPVGKGADAVIYDKITRRAFVPSAYDGLLTVIQVNSRSDIKVLEQAKTQIGTRTGAVDIKTGRLYLPTARFGSLNKLGWPEALPGTVELLVMEPTR
jgi:DNA-binding beta-propeller fold protein YncE